MDLSTEMLVLILYVVQQLGLVLGFGAQLMLLITYLRGKRDGVISETEDAVAHGIYRVLWVAIIFIISSGIGITAMHYFGGSSEIVAEPAFVFKWGLIALTMLFALLMRKGRIWNIFFEGLAGGTWTALFLIHIFAPIAELITLVQLYGEWLAGWLVVWFLLVHAMRGKVFEQKKKVETPVPISKPIPIQKPIPKIIPPPAPPRSIPNPVPPPPLPPPLPPIPQKPLPPIPPPIPIPIPKPPPPTPVSVPPIPKPKSETTTPESSIPDPDQSSGLPAIRVMPKTKEDVEKSNRPSIVTLQ